MILLTGHSRYDSLMLICFGTKSFTLWHWRFHGAISRHPGWWNNISVLFFASLRKRKAWEGLKSLAVEKEWEITLKLWFDDVSQICVYPEVSHIYTYIFFKSLIWRQAMFVILLCLSPREQVGEIQFPS